MRALLVTHGDLGAALLRSAGDLYPESAPIDALSNDGHDARSLRRAVERWLDEDDGPALLLVDFGGGSCGVAARAAAAGRERTWILGGVNLPMVLTFLGSHAQLDAEDLVSKILDRTLNAVTVIDRDS